MSLSSLAFIAFVLIVFGLFSASPSPRWRRGVLLVGNLVFVGSHASRWTALGPLAAYLAAGYVAIELVRRSGSRARLGVAIVAIVCGLLYLRGYWIVGAVPALPFAYMTVGLSYIMFRILHLAIDFQETRPPEPLPILSYLSYTCNFLTLVSGPIQFFRDFRDGQDRIAAPLDRTAAEMAVRRVVGGYFKVLAVSSLAKAAFDAAHGALFAGAIPQSAAAPAAAATAALYLIYLYFNFSGYTDIVIGIGRLFGQTLPENFDRPFAARNFQDYWARWHMTLSAWFRIYMFNPLLLVLASWFPAPRAMPLLGAAGFFVTFVAVGFWHGPTLPFVLLGMLFGFGASGHKLWQLGMTRFLGRARYKRICDNPLYAYAARGLTFAYMALAMTCFWSSMEELAMIAARLGWGGWLAALALLAAASGVVMAAGDAAMRGVRALRRGTATRRVPALIGDLSLSLQVVVIAIVVLAVLRPPEFVYQGF